MEENKVRKRDYIIKFMAVDFGKEGFELKFSKFGTILFIIFIAIIGYLASQLVINEISQRNIEIEKHRKTIEKLEGTILEKENVIKSKDLDLKRKDEEIKELEEFKNLINAIKNLSRRTLNEKEQEELALVIYRESLKYRYNWRMIMAVIMTESSFRAKLRSRDPSYGLMQLKFATAKEAGKKIGMELQNNYDLYNISTNVSLGGFYLFEQVLRFKDIKKALIAYNLGPTKTARIDREKGTEALTTRYFQKVLNNYNFLKENFN